MKNSKTQVILSPSPPHTRSPNCIWSFFAVIKISLVISQILQFYQCPFTVQPLQIIIFQCLYSKRKFYQQNFHWFISYFQPEHPSFDNCSLSLLYKSSITSISENHNKSLPKNTTDTFLPTFSNTTPASTTPILSIYNLRQEIGKK